MSTVLVDTNVLLDLATRDPVWLDWSLSAVNRVSSRGRLIVNAVIYAEMSIRFTTLERVDQFMAAAQIDVVEIPRIALFRAGKVFQDYRRRGGPRPGVLPDFFIGAHAEAAGLTLLTRDVRRYRSYFPTVDLIAPAT